MLLQLSLRFHGRSPAAPARPGRARARTGSWRRGAPRKRRRETRQADDHQGQGLSGGNGLGTVRARGVG
jgi:hypothetical protein